MGAGCVNYCLGFITCAHFFVLRIIFNKVIWQEVLKRNDQVVGWKNLSAMFHFRRLLWNFSPSLLTSLSTSQSLSTFLQFLLIISLINIAVIIIIIGFNVIYYKSSKFSADSIEEEAQENLSLAMMIICPRSCIWSKKANKFWFTPDTIWYTIW